MTFSIVAIDKKIQIIGVATTTANTSVGSRVPYVKEGIGAIATQGLTEGSYGIKGLELLEMGFTPQESLEKLLRSDPKNEHRQVIIIDIRGRKAAFTGKKTFESKGHIVGENYIVAGNMLATEDVIKGMAKAFKRKGEFVEKLLFALEAGKEAGGDIRGERSTTLVVVPSKTGGILNISVDDHPYPIKELRRLFEKQKDEL